MNKYDSYMHNLYVLLNNEAKKQVQKALKDVIQALIDIPKDDKLNDDIVENIIQNTRHLLSDQLQELLADEMGKIIEKVYKSTTTDFNASLAIHVGTYNIAQKNTVNKLTKQNLFWIGKHFGKDIDDGLVPLLNEAITNGYTNETTADKIKDLFKDMNRSQHYWKGFAENAVSRTHSISTIENMQIQGIKKAQIVAYMDDRTSDICRELNGRIIDLEPIIAVKDKLLSLSTEGRSSDEVKDDIQAIIPFLSDSDAQSMGSLSSADIQKKFSGIGIPPYHWLCRTKIIPWIEEFALPGRINQNNDIPNKFKINNLSQQEILNKLEGIIHNKYPKYSDDDFLPDFTKHGQTEFKLDTYEAFMQKAQSIYRNPDHIRCRSYKGQLQFTLYSDKHQGYVVVDSNSVIRGCYAHIGDNAVQKAYNRTSGIYYNITGVNNG